MKRYPGIRPFNTDESDRFFGRDQDIERLWRLIRLEQVVILYSKSGYGKSSLLAAGIYPKLAPAAAADLPAGKRYQHWEVRFGPYQGVESRSLLETLRSQITRSGEHQPVFPAGQFGNTLWQALKSRQAATGKRFILFFDQFEEIFTYPPEQVAAFKIQLAEALYTAVPDAVADAALTPEQETALNDPFELKVVFAIRADRMSQLNGLQDYLPNLLRHSYPLDALDEQQATAAITAPALLVEEQTDVASTDTPTPGAAAQRSIDLPAGFDTRPFRYDPAALALIFKELRDATTGKIETSALQIVCRHVEDNIVGPADAVATTIRTRHPHRTIGAADLGDIKSIFREFYDRTVTALPETQQPVARRLVEDVLIKDGIRLPFAEQALLAEPGVTRLLLQTLTAASLLRVERDEQGRMLYEVGHDTLVAPISEAAKTRRESEVQAAAREQLRLEAARQKEEKDKIARARRRNAAISIFALLLLGFSFWQNALASKQKALAEERTIAAEAAERRASEQASLAEQAEARADTSQSIAARKTKEAKQNAEATTLAMLQLGRTTENVVDALVKEVNDHIYRLEYPEALGKLEAVARFHKPTFAFTHAALELAFYYNEIGDRQSGVLYQIFPLLGQPRPRSQADCREYLRRTDRLWYSILLEKYYPVMVDVEGGAYYPGCIKSADCEITDSSYRAHVDKFQIARTETTFHQYNLYCQATGRTIFKYCGPLSWGFNGDNPVVNVSWFDACLYANWLSKQFGQREVYKMGEITRKYNEDYYADISLDTTATGFRLPTEAEWEWAARGGIKQDTFEFAGDFIIENVAWFYGNSGNRTHTVKTKKANVLGLYDMTGNVWEWCWDWFDTYPPGQVNNWRGPDIGDTRVYRGGGWFSNAGYCRATHRNYSGPTGRNYGIGFRLARSF